MKFDDGTLRLSATDLSSHLGCRHLTQLSRAVAEGTREAPHWQDPLLDALAQRGNIHEKRYLDVLRNEQGRKVLELDDVGVNEAAFERARAAMREGWDAIAQPALIDGRWRGRADVLLKVRTPSGLGDWSYEVVDTKLSNETRGGTLLQLCLYTEIVGSIQQHLPDSMYVVSPRRIREPERFRTRDYMAYYRLVRRQLEDALAGPKATPELIYPVPVNQCEICRWWPVCMERRRKDDHLSLVAGASRMQQRELVERGITTATQLAQAEQPIVSRPKRGSPEGYERIHHQARLQLESRSLPKPKYEFLEPIAAGLGLARLPEPSLGDIFLDLEGAHFVDDGGHEYLFGWVTADAAGETKYEARWALDRAEERRAFEAFIDTVMSRWEEHPDLHVYHFGHYEPSTMKRLMGRHGTREDELDRLLRAERFVDLLGVVRQGLRIGIESYSLKDLETLHDFQRDVDLREASAQRRVIDRALELGEREAITDESRSEVERYNRDDCISTWSLRNWLEERRAERSADGTLIPRPEPQEGEPSEELDAHQARRQALFERLIDGIPLEARERSDEHRARWLLAHMIEWHRREDKASWWELFRLRDLSDDELLEERAGLGGLEFVGEVPGGTAKCPIHRYAFPHQDYDIRREDKLHVAEASVGTVVDISPGARSIDIKKRGDASDLHPLAVFTHDHVGTRTMADAVERLALWVADHGIAAPGPYRAARDLLLTRHPRIASSTEGPLRKPGEDLLDAARRLALELEESCLPVQGPPGCGKTYMGARMICALVAQGKKVGITAVSHKVMQNLLEATLKAAAEIGMDLDCVHKPGKRSEPLPGIPEIKDNKKLLQAIEKNQANVAAATVWTWARPEFAEAVDVLIVDEAGQMSLCNTLAASQGAKNIVLLGDPQQLEQPMQGTHPEGSDVSALKHLLGDEETMRVERGLFLEDTWRLHPSLCEFTSELFYDRKLRSRAICEQQRILGETQYAGAGLHLFPVDHEGNQNHAVEEVSAVEAIYESLSARGIYWTNHNGETQLLEPTSDILIVAPYNAQVSAISSRLPNARVGTVDKFQGREAPVVIYSMTTSSCEDAPRGMEFLYSLNRMNVATSRAMCAVILVVNPKLLEPDCRTPRQVRLANALCRYREMVVSGAESQSLRG